VNREAEIKPGCSIAEICYMAKGNWVRIPLIPCLACIWAIGIVLGMLGMVRYQMTPAAPGREISRRWPANAGIARASGLATLVMMLHPQCPCSRASVHELGELTARAAGRLDAHVLFVEPPNAPADWLDGDLWKEAHAIPGVAVTVDKDGHDAAAFGATTSGQVMVFDPAGNLEFSGGITDGRGHEGDNAGLLSVLSLLREGKTAVFQTPVYGCWLGICRDVHH
jgi:hypothetical protein